MKKGSILLILGCFLLIWGANPAPSLEKVRFASHIKIIPLYVLPVLAAQEKGFFKAQGLELEWFGFEAGPAVAQALAAGSIDAGTTGLVSLIQALVRGVPAVVVADAGMVDDWFLWVLKDSPLKEPKDLKGGKVSVTRLGSLTDAFARGALKSLGLERDVKIVAMGGTGARVAALKAGATQGALGSFFSTAPLKAKGEVRELIDLSTYIPKGALAQIVVAHRDFLSRKPEVVRKMLRAFLQSGDFVLKNRAWTLEKMRSEFGYSRELAELTYPRLNYLTQVTMDRRLVEESVNFLVEYGLMAKAKAPAVDTIYTREFME